MPKIIDAHIHLDLYKEKNRVDLMSNLDGDSASLITVSFHLDSSKKNNELASQFNNVYATFGYHPEQAIPSDEDLSELLQWMDVYKDNMVAIGEVGLPYYLKQEQAMTVNEYERYIEVLIIFIKLAKQWDKPIVLHAVYDDAPVVCDLLEKYRVTKAHFHWFKGDAETIDRMIRNGYMISVTPDVCYEEEIQQLVKTYPLQQIMVETDGPWSFDGPFEGEMTHPNMIHHSVKKIAELKKLPVQDVYSTLYENTNKFYNLGL